MSDQSAVRPRAGSRCSRTSRQHPLLLLASLYGQWLLSWWVLGHRPQPTMDDPKSIAGASWMGHITALALLGLLPAGGCAAALNLLYTADRDLGGRMIMRLVLIAALWLGMFLLLICDPARVLYWWLD